MVGKATFSFALVASQYNQEYVQGLVTHAHQELNELEPGCTATLVWAPGAFEIPLLVKLVAEKKKYNAILALGVVLQGATSHADLIGRAVTDSLQRISLEYSVPVINEVLLLQNEEQARQRCLEPELNRGIEAARAAVSSARTVREIVSKL